MPRLKVKYRKEIIPEFVKEFSLKNPMEVPRIVKIIVNVGAGEAIQNPKVIDHIVEDISIITGQRPAVTRAKKSIAGFKIRKGNPIGCKVTIRGDRMYEFLDRLLSLALPRIRDFRGLSPKSFDGQGNFTIGVDEQLIFPEIDYDKIDKVRGMDITIVTTAQNDEHGFALLKYFGFPFKKVS
ncbi:50S ribosomal protein L5 [Candidatus Oleimmundimicrobium sp.]|uniref:50S ribosomal protein L5 n=1 Tax=Candidatus Oleimmundimicrobium sp. TaxID=3060597 RepID=UPI002722ACE5|nr:50S ribosomal protein L5 [Candidatus Oleimmundimicrobium sp.]MDO8886051.1 50S ribosomal protein L5 [Candidatus Oleimmundimicrobium sp.]